MSYDISLVIDTGGLAPATIGGADFWNYTSNCARMWRLAGADLAEFDGKTAGACLIVLEAAVMTMKRDPLPYLALNPDNGWGSYDTLLPALDELAAMFRAHPKATVVVSR